MGRDVAGMRGPDPQEGTSPENCCVDLMLEASLLDKHSFLCSHQCV
jgi:hypothetical protein